MCARIMRHHSTITSKAIFFTRYLNWCSLIRTKLHVLRTSDFCEWLYKNKRSNKRSYSRSEDVYFLDYSKDILFHYIL